MDIFRDEPRIGRTSGLVNFQQKQTANLDFLCEEDRKKMAEKHAKNQPLLVEDLCPACHEEAKRRMWEVYLAQKKNRGEK